MPRDSNARLLEAIVAILHRRRRCPWRRTVSPLQIAKPVLIGGWEVSLFACRYAQERERERHQYHNHSGHED